MLAATELGSNVLSSWRLLPDGFAVFCVKLVEYRPVVGCTFQDNLLHPPLDTGSYTESMRRKKSKPIDACVQLLWGPLNTGFTVIRNLTYLI